MEQLQWTLCRETLYLQHNLYTTKVNKSIIRKNTTYTSVFGPLRLNSATRRQYVIQMHKKPTVSIKLSEALPTTVNIQYIANWSSA